MKTTKHRPPHPTGDNTIQFVTARCYSNIPYLEIVKGAKDYFRQKMEQYAKELKIEIKAWIVLSNHYHILVEITRGTDLPEFIRKLHGATGRFVRKNEPDLVTEHGQVLNMPKTAWDRRQWKRYEERIGVIEELLRESRNLPAKPAARRWQAGKLRYSRRERPAERGYSRGEKNKNLAYGENLVPHKARNSELQFAIRKQLQQQNINLKTTPLTAESISLLLIKSSPIWYQYINRIITSERDYFCHFNYIHQNPVKHGYVKDPFAYRWSSIADFDKEYIADAFREYPIRDFRPEWDIE